VVKAPKVGQPTLSYCELDSSGELKKNTHLLVTEVKRDFQTNSQKNHEYHQREPEPNPQGYGCPSTGGFMIMIKD
jgi:hypothetical protein